MKMDMGLVYRISPGWWIWGLGRDGVRGGSLVTDVVVEGSQRQFCCWWL